jgi:hypothetical protein
MANKIAREQADKVAALFERAGKAADKIGEAAGRVKASVDKAERELWLARRSLRTAAAGGSGDRGMRSAARVTTTGRAAARYGASPTRWP